MSIFKAGGSLNPTEDYKVILERLEFHRILNHVEAEELYIALCSPRQTGKTTILCQVHKHLYEKGYGVVYIDLSNFEDLERIDFYSAFCNEICACLNNKILNQSDISFHSQTIANQIDFENYLKQLSRSTPQVRKLIFILDEIGGVPIQLSKNFFSTIRKVYSIGKSNRPDQELCKKIFFIFAGALDLKKLTQGKNSPLSNICEHISLSDFSEEKVLDLASNLESYSWENIKTWLPDRSR